MVNIKGFPNQNMFSTLTRSSVFPRLAKILPRYMSGFCCLCVEAEEWANTAPKQCHYFQVYLPLALQLRDISIGSSVFLLADSSS